MTKLFYNKYKTYSCCSCARDDNGACPALGHKYWNKLRKSHSTVVSTCQVLTTYYQLLCAVGDPSIGPWWATLVCFVCRISSCCRLLKHNFNDIRQTEPLIGNDGLQLLLLTFFINEPFIVNGL